MAKKVYLSEAQLRNYIRLQKNKLAEKVMDYDETEKRSRDAINDFERDCDFGPDFYRKGKNKLDNKFDPDDGLKWYRKGKKVHNLNGYVSPKRKKAETKFDWKCIDKFDKRFNDWHYHDGENLNIDEWPHAGWDALTNDNEPETWGGKSDHWKGNAETSGKDESTFLMHNLGISDDGKRDSLHDYKYTEDNILDKKKKKKATKKSKKLRESYDDFEYPDEREMMGDEAYYEMQMRNNQEEDDLESVLKEERENRIKKFNHLLLFDSDKNRF